ncbi:MAG TPA: pilus assembly protein TadG-related protein [Candidatus Binataceae bacterium]|nr:pilus assembly protein TadG-related protein [Candidatus Binataceae bacterium]
MNRARLKSQSGQIWVLVAAAITVVLASVGMAGDIGVLYLQRHKMQSAADSAALAGADELNYGDTVSAARKDASSNGYANGVGSTTVTVNNPPTSGQYSGNSKYVEVIISKVQSTYFLPVLGIGSLNVAARAVAGESNASGCMYSLDPTMSGAVSGNGNITINGPCGMIVDSNSSTALSVSGGSATFDTPVGIVGGYTIGNATFNPPPHTGIISTGDPLAYYSPPTFSGCDYKNTTVNKTQTLNPGVYCGGITIKGNADVTFNPGTYILNGGGLSASGTHTITGTGVTFYNTQGYSAFAPISLSGNVTVNLSAPTSGPMEAMLFFQDRSITSSLMNTVGGNSSTTYDGAIYMPNSPLTYYGNSSANGYTILVADSLSFSGNVTIGNNYSSLNDGSPIRTVLLAE